MMDKIRKGVLKIGKIVQSRGREKNRENWKINN